MGIHPIFWSPLVSETKKNRCLLVNWGVKHHTSAVLGFKTCQPAALWVWFNKSGPEDPALSQGRGCWWHGPRARLEIPVTDFSLWCTKYIKLTLSWHPACPEPIEPISQHYQLGPSRGGRPVAQYGDLGLVYFYSCSTAHKGAIPQLIRRLTWTLPVCGLTVCVIFLWVTQLAVMYHLHNPSRHPITSKWENFLIVLNIIIHLLPNSMAYDKMQFLIMKRKLFLMGSPFRPLLHDDNLSWPTSPLKKCFSFIYMRQCVQNQFIQQVFTEYCW